MTQTKRERVYQGAVSVIVAGLLTAQAITIGLTATGTTGLRQKIFPILEYPMYAPAHYEGERVTATWHLEGVLSNGETIPISREDLLLSIWDYNRIVQSAMLRRPHGIENFERIIRARAPQSGDIREVRIISYGIRVTREGPEEIPPELAMTIPLSPPS